MFSIKTILESGISLENSDYLNQKIKLCNGMAVFMSLTGLFYLFIAISMMPPLLPYVIAGLLNFIAVPFLNRNGANIVARYCMSIGTAMLCFVAHIANVQEGESGITGSYAIQIAFVVLPWVLFDTRESFHLFFTFAVCVSFIVLVEPLSGWIEPEPSASMAMFREPGMQKMNLITAAIILGGIMYVLQQNNQGMDKKNEELIASAALKQQELKNNEDKLSNYIAEIEKTQIEDKKREWANNGLAKFANILRADQEDIQKTYDTIITNLVNYMAANQGGLFVVEENLIELKSCYAYERKKFLTKKIEFGEGLVGQCYFERDVIYLTEVPKTYAAITSGIGEATPTAILIVPLMLNDEVYGIIELAGFKPFETYKIEFMTKVCENIASAISNLKINERTKLLLEESQQQSEEMRSQEEEMRQNMEELSATQEEMARKHKEMEEAMQEMQHKASLLDAAQIEISDLKNKLEKALLPA